MTLAALLNLPCTITRRTQNGAADDYGNPTYTTTTTTTVCELQQQVASEDVVDRDGQASDSILILPAGTGIDGGDKVTVSGVDYEVDGPPWAARNPRTGLAHHVECRVVRRAV